MIEFILHWVMIWHLCGESWGPLALSAHLCPIPPWCSHCVDACCEDPYGSDAGERGC